MGINNGAIIVVDNKTMQILAYIGSPNYFDHKNNGKVNGAKILRSPGSTRKPFIYAKAIDKGLITPKKLSMTYLNTMQMILYHITFQKIQVVL